MYSSEQGFVTSLMERAWDIDVWIGLSAAKETPNYFNWSDGSVVRWTNWGLGHPHGVWTGEYCVYINLKRAVKHLMYWRVAKCNEEKIFICKKTICKFCTFVEWYEYLRQVTYQNYCHAWLSNAWTELLYCLV